ncbi:MAG: hypothetical protein J6S38_03330, partial [Erysipelotrichaceae bacterium]|nr:hypothetical protein [Erysipelotrichaceae bacterium]
MKKIANLVLMILMLCMLMPCRFVVQAEEEENEVIQATFYSVTTRKNSTIEVEFNKHWFDDRASNYSHDLAKLSLGLATSAFRPKRSENGQQDLAGKNLNDFLVAAHFEDIRSDDYDKDPSMYTISTAMGHQQIEGEDGSYELIAIGICGQGYVDEWESNFTIGDGFNHEGFEQASRLVYDRIFGYIAEKKLQGHLKIWISGFSRAAAVSNLTAAKLSDSMIFDNDDVFAYTFATPRTTTDPEPGRYPNIFNIVGKADPVPMLPFKQWGYNRYGVDLYLPSYETDSDFEVKRAKANEIYRQISGIDYWYNREVNETLHDILTFILVICPSAKLYTNSLQNKLIHIWENNDAISIMAALLEISEDPVLINEDTRIEANELMNYLTAMIISYRNDDSIMRGWNPSASTYANIMQIHTPNLYISWVFSADSYEEVYTDYDSYSIAYIESAFDVSLYRDGEYVESIPAIIDLDYETGKKNVLIKEKDRKVPEGNLYLTYYDENIAAVLPKDRDYSLRSKSEDEEKTVEVFFIEHKIYSGSENEVDYYSYDMEANDQLIVSRDEDNKWAFETDKGFKEDRFAKGEGKMSASTAIEIRKPRAYYRLTWRQAAILTIAVGLFV